MNIDSRQKKRHTINQELVYHLKMGRAKKETPIDLPNDLLGASSVSTDAGVDYFSPFFSTMNIGLRTKTDDVFCSFVQLWERWCTMIGSRFLTIIFKFFYEVITINEVTKKKEKRKLISLSVSFYCNIDMNWKKKHYQIENQAQMEHQLPNLVSQFQWIFK